VLICQINWKHPDTSAPGPPPPSVSGADPLLLAFSGDVVAGDIHEHSFMVLVNTSNQESPVKCWCEVKPRELAPVRFQTSCNVASPLTTVTNPGDPANGLQFRPRREWARDTDYRVVLKGDLVREFKDPRRAIDANHLPPWLNARKTGDGKQGGTFESWFRTK
jgi:hypothetical protein